MESCAQEGLLLIQIKMALLLVKNHGKIQTTE